MFVSFIYQLENPPHGALKKKFSVDIQLLSYTFLIRLINRAFNLHSNFTLVARESSILKCDFIVHDDFDVDGCVFNMFDVDNHDPESNSMSAVEFIVYKYPLTKDQLESDLTALDEQHMTDNERFELIFLYDDCIIVTIKPKDRRQTTLLQKATSMIHRQRRQGKQWTHSYLSRLATWFRSFIK
jgi:hypothetical protein